VDLVSFHPNSQHIDRLSTPKENTMDNVVVGNVCQDPILRQSFRGGQPYAKFSVAVHLRRKVGDEYVDRPTVFHRVVCFGQLAENVTNSLRIGMEVMVVGDWADDSYTDGDGQRHVRMVMEARTLGPTLRWATAQVTRTERPSDTLDLFATASARQPTPADPTTTPAEETPTTEHPVIRGLPTTVPSADAGGTTRRRKKPEPEPAISRAS
jgi:single-strand DNA-binding protein